MNHSPLEARILRLLIVGCCVLLILTGISLTLQNARFIDITAPKPNSSSDSSYTKKLTQIDSAEKTRQSTITENSVKVNSQPPAGAANCCDVIVAHNESLLKKGYDLIFLGIILLLVFYALPWLSEFSFLQVFSLKLRDKVDTQKLAANEATNATNSTAASIPPDAVTEKPIQAEQREMVKTLFLNKEIQAETYAAYSDDPQKGKWGSSPVRNSRKITASVTKLPTSDQLFKVVIKVFSTDPDTPLRNSVIFHLHPSFAEPDPKIYVLQGVATLELIAWGAFTVGAEADFGTTRLELDLAGLPEAPLLFKSR